MQKMKASVSLTSLVRIAIDALNAEVPPVYVKTGRATVLGEKIEKQIIQILKRTLIATVTKFDLS